jgi:hypothetical protein
MKKYSEIGAWSNGHRLVRRYDGALPPSPSVVSDEFVAKVIGRVGVTMPTGKANHCAGRSGAPTRGQLVQGGKITGKRWEMGGVVPSHAGRSQPQHMFGGVSKQAPDAEPALVFILSEKRNRTRAACQSFTQCGHPGLNAQNWNERTFHGFRRSEPTPAHNEKPNSTRMERNGPNRKSGRKIAIGTETAKA